MQNTNLGLAERAAAIKCLFEPLTFVCVAYFAHPARTSKQASKQTSKQASKQASKQTPTTMAT